MKKPAPRIRGIALFWACGLVAAVGPAGPGWAETDAPTLRILSPDSGSFLSGKVTVTTQTVGGEDPLRLNLLWDGVPVEKSVHPPDRLEWDTSTELDGPHTLQVRAVDAQGRQGISEPIRVTVDNTPPRVQVVRPTPQTIWVGNAEAEVQASDTIALAEVRLLVDGVVRHTLKEPPFRFLWDSTTLSNGTHTVEARAVDQAGNGSLSQAIAVRIANKNRPPIFAPLGEQEVQEGETLSFTVSASDPDGPRDQVTYRAYDLPGWASFQPDTGQLQATPDHSAATLEKPEQVYRVRFQACDPEPLCATLEVPIRVRNVNQAPRLPPLPEGVTVREGEPVVIRLDAATDPDDEELTYTAKPLPGWMTFDPSSRLFTGTPGYEIATLKEPRVAYDITVKACDPDLQCDAQILRIVLENKNRAPVFRRISDKTIEEGKTFAFALEATDPDGDPLRIGAEAMPEGATFQDAGNGSGAFLWASRLDQGGRYRLTFVATDGDLLDVQKVNITLQEGSLSISGVIRDSLEAPFPGATVKCTGPGKLSRYATTDSNGFYLISDLSSGPYRLKPDVQISDEFSSKARDSISYHFSPLSHRVVLDRSDRTQVDFTALPD